MGYWKTTSGITNFDPDNTPNALYIERGADFQDLISAIKAHFGEDAQLEDFRISAENIHTHCIGYDLHDAGDYTNFILIERKS